MNIPKKIKFIYSFIDLLYISDLLLSFFRTQYDINLKIIKGSEITIKNQFILDFLKQFLYFQSYHLYAKIIMIIVQNILLVSNKHYFYFLYFYRTSIISKLDNFNKL